MRRAASKIEGERSSVLDLSRGRLVLVSAFFVLAYAILVLRAFDLTVIQAVDKEAKAQHEELVQNSVKSGESRRSDIVDRNGVILATTLKISSLFADSKRIADPASAAKKLIKIFPEMSYGDTLQKLQSGKRFIWLKRRITPEQKIEVLKIGEPGLEFEHEYQRFYPQENLAVHMVGYTSLDNQGLSGIERSFDPLLSKGQEPLRLTLDVRLQHALRRELKKSMDSFEAIGAAGGIMDINTGEILGASSLPDFNPHQIKKVEDKELFNRVTLGVYELGSVFKIFSTAVFFEEKNVPVNVTFDATQPVKAGRFEINDYHAENRILTAPEVFMYSSNIGSAMMGQAVGTERLKAFYRDLGLLDPLDFEVREVARPLVPNPWTDISTLTASYGHGLATTPLQLTAAVSSIVNGGYLVKPRLVLDDEPFYDENERISIVSNETVQRMRAFMRLVVTDGTGRNADVKGYRVGGKTGTAEKIVNGRYDRKKLISSFIGVFPMDEPRYAIYIAVDEPKGQKWSYGYATAGWVAAPAVKNVISSMASIMGIVPAKEDSPQQNFGSSLKQYVSIKKKH